MNTLNMSDLLDLKLEDEERKTFQQPLFVSFCCIRPYISYIIPIPRI